MDVPRPRRSPYPRLARAIGVGMAGVVGVAAGIGVLAKASIVWLEKTTPLAAATTSPARPVGVEIPETYELANVAIALTNFAERRRHTIYRDSPYYASVMARFGERRTHPLITRLNEQLDGPNEWRAFYGFRENSVSFEIEGERLRRSSRYPAAIWRGNVFADDSALVADFARVTNFHEFYEKNRAFYRGQIAEYQRETPIAKMWDWLEARFPDRYDRYRVVFSPLSYGSHSTQRFTEGGVSETIMFIAGPFATAKAVNSRMREAICRTLSAEGFLGGVEVAGEIPNKKLLVGLRYSGEREPVIRGIERVSRPSLRRYAGANSMPRVPHGMGVQVVTTPLGVMTDREARRKKVGGEILLRIW